MTKTKTICISGGFDPVHIGHLRMMQAASKYGDVITIVNSDAWLMRKKGYIFMPFKERCEIIEGFESVNCTSYVNDKDNTVCEALRRLKPDYFANGGDRKTDNTPEMDICEELGIDMLWGVGGGKIQSSSTLVDDSGMISPSIKVTEIDGVELTPSRVDVIAAGDVAKRSDY
jgi:cytidyltransferase-like protein